MRNCLLPCWLGLCLFWLSGVAAAEIGVAVDRNPVGLNESFQITFTAAEQPDAVRISSRYGRISRSSTNNAALARPGLTAKAAATNNGF